MFLRDKLGHLLGAAFSVLLAAVLLTVLDVTAAAVGFLCLVIALCALAPLCAEYARKRAFYNGTMDVLDSLEEKYLLPALLEEPFFAEGVLFTQAMAQVAKSMNDSVADARRDMAEYREYIETWVHEVKTPISSARLALENSPGPLAERLEGELFEIDNYVEQALFYARGGAVDRDYLVKAMPLRDAAAATVKKYARPLIAAGFQIDLSGLDASAYSDPKWVEFILGQIVSNAIKYRGSAPRLTFKQRVEEQSVTLSVEDNGVGIPAAELPRVCDKGFTGTNGRNLSTRSTGLGLYLCRKLCGLLGLRFTVESAEGAWTRVSITFPKGRFHLAGER